MVGKPINPNKPIGLGIDYQGVRWPNKHPNQRLKKEKKDSIDEAIFKSNIDELIRIGQPEYRSMPTGGKYARMVSDFKRDELERKEMEEKLAEAKAKAEEEAAFLDSPKGRLQSMWADADRRDAILGGIADAMLETRVGAYAYGSRLDSAQKNVRQNLKLAEATEMARTQAALDMAKTQAETNKLLNPAQFMSDTQREASDIASMEHVFGSPEWKEKYAGELRRIAYKDMLTGPVDAIIAINEYILRAPGMDETQKQVYTEIIQQLMTNIRSASGGEAPATSRSQSTIVGGADPGL